MNIDKNKKRNRAGFTFEKRLWRRGVKFIAGADEVGRGSFAGPIVAAACAFAPRTALTFSRGLRPRVEGAGVRGKPVVAENVIINDSKKLTKLQRDRADKWIKKNTLSWGIGEVSAALINRLGMGKATKVAFRKAVKAANFKFQNPNYKIDFLLIDAYFIPYLRDYPKGRNKIKGDKNPRISNGSKQLAIVKGDEKSFSIAAASIIAKVYRDNLMKKISEIPKFQVYGWHNNKGYGTKEHRKAILKYGLTDQHRRDFVSNIE